MCVCVCVCVRECVRVCSCVRAGVSASVFVSFSLFYFFLLPDIGHFCYVYKLFLLKTI